MMYQRFISHEVEAWNLSQVINANVIKVVITRSLRGGRRSHALVGKYNIR